MKQLNTCNICPPRVVGSGGCVGTGFWITTLCPSVTSGGAYQATSMLHMRDTMADLSSSKVRKSHTLMVMISSSLLPAEFNS